MNVDTKILSDFHDTDYPTTAESEDDGAGGGKINPLLLEVSEVYCGPEKKNGKRVNVYDVLRAMVIGQLRHIHERRAAFLNMRRAVAKE